MVSELYLEKKKFSEFTHYYIPLFKYKISEIIKLEAYGHCLHFQLSSSDTDDEENRLMIGFLARHLNLARWRKRSAVRI